MSYTSNWCEIPDAMPWNPWHFPSIELRTRKSRYGQAERQIESTGDVWCMYPSNDANTLQITYKTHILPRLFDSLRLSPKTVISQPRSPVWVQPPPQSLSGTEAIESASYGPPEMVRRPLYSTDSWISPALLEYKTDCQNQVIGQSVGLDPYQAL